MNKLKKDQKDEFAVSYAILALYDGGAEVTSEQINTLLEATGNTQVAPYYPIIFSNFLNTPAKIGAAIANPGAGSGGGGGGGGGGAAAGGAAAEAEEEKPEEEEEADMGGGMDMFGGGDAGGGGDY